MKTIPIFKNGTSYGWRLLSLVFAKQRQEKQTSSLETFILFYQTFINKVFLSLSQQMEIPAFDIGLHCIERVFKQWIQQMKTPSSVTTF